MNSGPASKRKPPGRVRIIGGTHGGRRLPLANADIRPTPDRVRETLFNWLQPVLPGSRCLDLFAGSGALGIEALSRGAALAVLVEKDPATARHLDQVLMKLDLAGGQVIHGDAFRYLKNAPRPFDVVFLDPPFRLNALGNLCTLLQQQGWLSPGAHIYMECADSSDLSAVPGNWEMLRKKRAGQVIFALARCGD